MVSRSVIGMGKGKNRAGRRNTLMLCVNAEDCGRKRMGTGKEHRMEARKVKGGNSMKSSKYV